MYENMRTNKIDNYKLFVDELGTPNTKDKKSELYILSGCSVEEAERHNLKIRADQIKFKYWGRTDIIFHSREIGRKENDFEIFKNSKVYNEFLKDLEVFLSEAKFKMFFIIVNKEKARRLAWNNVKIYKETSNILIKNFLLILLSGDSKGKIIIESAAEKDLYIYKAFNYFLAGGIKELKVSHKKVQEILTSFSFVNKQNYDIEEQIADLFAYAARCYYFIKVKKKIKIGLYEKIMISLLKKKLFKVPFRANPRKTKYFKNVNAFVILPQ